MAQNCYFDPRLLKGAQVAERVTWERQPDESAKAYSRFAVYRDLRGQRSLIGVIRNLISSGGPRITLPTISEMAMRHKWKERAQAFDLFEHRQLEKERAGERREARQRQIRLGEALQKVALHALGELVDKVRAGLALNLSPTEIAKLASAGQALEREGLGDTRDPLVIPEIVVKYGDREQDEEPQEPKVSGKPN